MKKETIIAQLEDCNLKVVGMCNMHVAAKCGKNSIRDDRTPQPGKIVFNTMTYRSSETVPRPGYFQRCVTYKKVQIMFN